jgi:hypothetical protein
MCCTKEGTISLAPSLRGPRRRESCVSWFNTKSVPVVPFITHWTVVFHHNAKASSGSACSPMAARSIPDTLTAADTAAEPCSTYFRSLHSLMVTVPSGERFASTPQSFQRALVYMYGLMLLRQWPHYILNGVPRYLSVTGHNSGGAALYGLDKVQQGC